jgi:hypothetical protein
MTENKHKTEGNPRFCGRPARNAGPVKKEFVTKVVGLETHTFDIGSAKYVAKYQKLVDAIANHVQKEYKGGPKIAKAIKELSLSTILIPNYPTADSGGNVDPGDVFLWQEDVQEAKKRISFLVKKKKCAYALILGQCSMELISKIKRLGG